MTNRSLQVAIVLVWGLGLRGSGSGVSNLLQQAPPRQPLRVQPPLREPHEGREADVVGARQQRHPHRLVLPQENLEMHRLSPAASVNPKP